MVISVSLENTTIKQFCQETVKRAIAPDKLPDGDNSDIKLIRVAVDRSMPIIGQRG